MDPTRLPATRLAEAIAAGELSSARGGRGAPAPDRGGQPARQRRRAGRRRPRARRGARGRRDQRAARARCTASRSRSRTTSRRPGSRWRSARRSGWAWSPATDATVVARMREAGAILLGKTNCPEYGGGIETDNAVYGRTNNPYDLDAHAGRQLRRRGGGDRGRLLALRPRHRLGRQRAPARPLLRPRRAQADLRPRPGHRRDRRPRPDRRARRPAHPGRHPRPLGARRRAHPRARQRPRRRRRRRPARPADGARRGRPARPPRRGPDRQRARHPDARDRRRDRGRGAGARGGGRAGRAREPARRRPRADDRRLALLRRRLGPLRHPAPLGRLPQRDARLVRGLRPRSSAPSSPSPPAATAT